MKKPKLELLFKKLDSPKKWGILMQVRQMDERFRYKGEDAEPISPIHSLNGFDIVSATHPDINVETKSIFLRGISLQDSHKYVVANFDTEAERDEFYDKALAAFHDWGKNWEGFKGDPEPEYAVSYKVDGDVYDFNGKLKMRIVEFEQGLGCQILSQHDKFKKHILLDGDLKYECKNGLTIVSTDIGPEVLNYKKVVRLSNSETNQPSPVFGINFNTTVQCNESKRVLLEALSDWSFNWPGWKEEPKQDEEGIITIW